MTYRKPSKRIHRGFFYLDDETVINSLSAFESGKIDEVVAKVNSAREGGFGGGVGPAALSLEGGRKSSSAFEEQMVRTRTRFSVFELWYQSLVDGKALGTFDGWGLGALEGVRSGDTIEIRATLDLAPIQTLFRLYLWFAEQAKMSGTPFSQKGEALQQTKTAERLMRLFLGGAEPSEVEVVLIATPLGEAGPTVAMPVLPDWLIGKVGRLGGEFTIVGQVDQVLAAEEEFPTLRLTQDVTATPLELDTLRNAIANFVEPSRALGIELTESAASIIGPAIWVRPIAIFK